MILLSRHDEYIFTNAEFISYGRDAVTGLIDALRRLTAKRKGRCSPNPDTPESREATRATHDSRNTSPPHKQRHSFDRIDPIRQIQEATNAPTRTYRYRELSGVNSIRLLLFLPDSGDEDFRCIIKEYDVKSESIPYIALSYVWGDASIRHPIFLDGRIAHVTANLREALTHLIIAFPQSNFWIDAICIDQDNSKERMHQVGQMRTIYSNAAQVVMWLGPGNRDIEELSLMIDSHWDHCLSPNSGNDFCNFNIDPSIVAAIVHLVQNPYWHRVWIIQEVTAAKKSTIMCGTTSLEWPRLGRFLDRLRFNHFEHPAGIKLHHLDRTLPMIRLYNWNHSVMHLAAALYWSSTSYATDDRDKVYAILGLVDKGAGRLLSADYTLSLCSVFCLAIRAMVVDCKSDVCRHNLRGQLSNIAEACLDDALERDLKPAGKKVC